MKAARTAGLAGILLLTALGAAADDAELPQRVQPPQPRPDRNEAASGQDASQPAVATVPTPTPKPNIAPLGYAPHQPENNPIARTVPPDLRGPRGAMPVDEVACRAALKKLGAEFEEAKPQTDAAGCDMPYPVILRKMNGEVSVEPEVTLNCQIALASARFTGEVIQKAALSKLKSPVKSISQASGYVCRPRHGTRRLSEHAFGNALDIASLTLKNGTVVKVQPSPPADQAGFLSAVRGAACGPFKTVLGPGSDADHAFHLHLDLAQRRNGGTYCR